MVSCGKQIAVAPCNLQVLACGRRIVANAEAPTGKTMGTIRRVLRTGGEFHMLDFEGPEKGAHGILSRMLHSNQRLKDNSENRVLPFVTEAGFAEPKKVGHWEMFFGHIAYYRAIA